MRWLALFPALSGYMVVINFGTNKCNNNILEFFFCFYVRNRLSR